MVNSGDAEEGSNLSDVEGTGEKMARGMLESGYGMSLKSLVLQKSIRGRGFKVHLSYAAEFTNQPSRVITVTVDVVLRKIELEKDLLFSMPNRAWVEDVVVEKLWDW